MKWEVEIGYNVIINFEHTDTHSHEKKKKQKTSLGCLNVIVPSHSVIFDSFASTAAVVVAPQSFHL